MSTQFCEFELQATDVEAARAFYAAVLGERALAIVPQSEVAAKRGAPAIWLGQLAVDDVAQAAGALVARGALQLGPLRRTRQGGMLAVLRDPGGAMLAVGTPRTSQADVVWCHLDTHAAASALATYTELFGWQATESSQVADHGTVQQFAWEPGGESAGSIAEIAGRPGIHPHWCFHFRVDALAPALAAVKAAGGVVLAELSLPSGVRFAVCDDAQGAGFALRT